MSMGDDEEDQAGDAANVPLAACGWYHGPITRIAAEMSVLDDGDFLVRDCISSPGDLVLTCRSAGQVMHFRLNSGRADEDGDNVKRYHLEGPQMYHSVSALISAHVNEKRPLSAVSGALIMRPVLREDADRNGVNGHDASPPGKEGKHETATKTTSFRDLPSSQPDPRAPASFTSFKPPQIGPFSSSAPKEIRGAWSKDESASVEDKGRACVGGSHGGPAGALSRIFFSEKVKAGHKSWPKGERPTTAKATTGISTLPRKPHTSGEPRFHSLPRPKTSGLFAKVGPRGRGGDVDGDEGGRAGSSTEMRRSPSDSSIPSTTLEGANPDLPPPPPPPPSSSSSGDQTGRKRRPLPPPPAPARARKSLVAAGFARARPSRQQQEPFPQDIVLPDSKGLPPPPPPPALLPAALAQPPTTGNKAHSPTYDVPATPPDSILSETQVSGSKLYDRPRPVGRLKAPPPPPPARKSKGTVSTERAGKAMANVLRVSYAASEERHAAESSAVESNTEDTSFLEHRELTPLLSDDDSLVGVDDASSLPGDPFPAGLPAKVKATRTTSSSSTSSASSSSSSLDSSPPTESHQTSSANGKEIITTEAIVEEPPLPNASLLAVAEWKSQHFFAGDKYNKPLDAVAVTLLREVIQKHAGKLAAAQIFALDAQLLSLDKMDVGEEGFLCGLPALTLVGGRRLREDLMERWLCSRWVVLVTVFAAPTPREGADALSAWISTARELFKSGDRFSLSALVLALNDERLRSLRSPWEVLRRERPKSSAELVDLTAAVRRSHDQADGDDGGNVALPDLAPYLSGCRDLKERRVFRKVFADIFGDRAESPDASPAFQSHLRCVHEHLKNLQQLKAAAAAVVAEAPQLADPLLAEALDTRLHLRLLWGSKGATAAADERHCKFSRVVAALATLCLEAERAQQ